MQYKEISVRSISENYLFYKNLAGTKPDSLKWDVAIFKTEGFEIRLVESEDAISAVFDLELSTEDLIKTFRRMSRFVKPVSFGDSCKPLKDHFALKDPEGNQLLIRTSEFKRSLTKVEDCYLETFEI